VTYDSAPIVDLGNDTTLCDGQSLLLDATITSATYLWQDNSTAATLTVTSAGTYWVEVTDGCAERDTVFVNYNPVPQVDLGNDTAICIGEMIVLDATTPSATYLWQDNTTNPTYSATAGVVYSVAVIVDGCAGHDTLSVADAHCGCHLAVANAFTPNGDGHNDIFAPILDCSPSEYTFSVFNRWGHVIFETNDPELGWDGTFKGREMPIGAYTYLVRYTHVSEPEPGVAAGNVTLLR
jgi:gliding motility-associated-like protein